MSLATYAERRERLQTYFDATAVKAWAQLTSDAPVSRIRETVRQGRDRMRATILSWLPEDLCGRRLLDAGCGTGALAVLAAARGAQVTAVDIAGNLIALGVERAPATFVGGAVDFRVGDMLSPDLGAFDHVVAMDSLIHYSTREIVEVVSALCARTTVSIIFTIAPQTPLLTAMHAAGRLFPRSNRSPALEPIAEKRLGRALLAQPALADWRIARSERIGSGFYTSQALELVRR